MRSELPAGRAASAELRSPLLFSHFIRCFQSLMCVCSIQVMSSAGIPTCQLSLSTANGTGHPFNSPYRTLYWVVLPDVLFHNCQNSSAIIDECWKHLFLKESYIPNNASTSYWKLANTPEWFIYYNLLVLCHMVLKQMKRKIFSSSCHR